MDYPEEFSKIQASYISEIANVLFTEGCAPGQEVSPNLFWDDMAESSKAAHKEWVIHSWLGIKRTNFSFSYQKMCRAFWPVLISRGLISNEIKTTVFLKDGSVNTKDSSDLPLYLALSDFFSQQTCESNLIS